MGNFELSQAAKSEYVFNHLPENDQQYLRELHAKNKHDGCGIINCEACSVEARSNGVHIPSYKVEVGEQYEYVFNVLSENNKQTLRDMHMKNKHDRWGVDKCVKCRWEAFRNGMNIPSYSSLVNEP